MHGKSILRRMAPVIRKFARLLDGLGMELEMGCRNKMVESLGLPVRALRSLQRAHIETVGELLGKTEKDLLLLRNFGPKSLEVLNERLRDLDLSLRQ